MGRGMLLAACLVGCDPTAATMPDGAPPDASTPTDAQPADVDPGPPDRGPPDAAPDAAPPDAEPDARVDAEPDAAPDAAPDAGPPTERTVVHIEPGPTRVGEPIAFDLPPGMRALLIQARGPADAVIGLHTVDGPGGPLITADGSRVTLNPEVAVALLPNTGRVEPLPPGPYTAVFASAGPDDRPLEVDVYAVDGPGGALDVTLHVPPTLRTPDEPAIDAMTAALEAQLGLAFDVEATVTARALPAGSPDTLLVDGAALDFAALVELGRAAGDGAGPGIDLFLVDRIADGADGLTGFSGGLPAPLGLPGSAASVIAIPQALLDDFPDAVADRAVHEIGHALGLFHTTGPFGRLDPIDDTPACPAECDTDGDGVLFARECGARGRGDDPCRGAADNLMFWTLGGDRVVTEGQRTVARHHPLVR